MKYFDIVLKFFIDVEIVIYLFNSCLFYDVVNMKLLFCVIWYYKSFTTDIFESSRARQTMMSHTFLEHIPECETNLFINYTPQ